MARFAVFVCALWGMMVGCGSAPPPPAEMSFSSAKAFNPLTACRTTEFSRFTRGVECGPTNILFISREPGSAEVLAALEKNLQAYGYEVMQAPLMINARETEALSYTMGSSEKPAVSVRATAFALSGSTESIEAQCYAYGALVDPKRCASLFDAFIEQGLLRGEWPRVLSQTEIRDPLTFEVAGRAVRLPRACDELAPFDVRCKEGRVRMLVADAAEQLPRMLGLELKASADASLAREWTAPCTVEGVATSCTMRRYRLPFNDELHSYYATVTVRGRPLLLSCSTKRSLAERLPGAICGQFFVFAEGDLEEPPLPEEEEQ